MKRITILLLLVLTLWGCSAEADTTEDALALRSRILGAERCTFDAAITADYGDQTYTFAMGCQVDAHGDLSFTVTEPKSIAGITGRITNDGGSLTFDDTALAFALLADDQLSPVSAPWILMKTLRGGYITACTDGRVTINDTYAADAFTLDIYLDDAHNPIQADIYWKDRRILTIDVKNFTLS